MKATAGRPSSRDKILDAAEALAREEGPGNISLDAVAARAGLSKGGLLYNFPSKAKLLEALVERHIQHTRATLAAAMCERAGEVNAVACAYLDNFREESKIEKPSGPGVFAAIAENPEFIAPIRNYHREVVEELRKYSADPTMAIVSFLVVEGLRSLTLFESDCLSPQNVEDVLARLDCELNAKS